MALTSLPLICLLVLLVASRQMLAQNPVRNQSLFQHRTSPPNDASFYELNHTTLDPLNDASLGTLDGIDLANQNETGIDILNDTDLDSQNYTNPDNQNITVFTLNGTDLDNLNSTDLDNLHGSDLDSLGRTDLDNQNHTSLDSLNRNSLHNKNFTRFDNQNDTAYENQINTENRANSLMLEDNRTNVDEMDEVPVIAGKCCIPDEHYSSSYYCMKWKEDMLDNIALLKEFWVKDMLSNATYDSAKNDSLGNLGCQTIVNDYQLDNAFNDTSDQLWDYNEKCYSSYCINHHSKEHNAILSALAFGCLKYSFRKCCPEQQRLSDAGCVAHSQTLVSPRMRDLQNRFPSKVGFPIIDSEPCQLEHWGTADTDRPWFIDYYGNLRHSEVLAPTEHYCVDDQLNHNRKPQLVAKICASEISHTKKQALIGKCCSTSEYLYVYESGASDCISDDEIDDFMEHPQVKKLSFPCFVEEYIPQCPFGFLFHYFFDEEELDYAELQSGGMLDVVNAICGREIGRSHFNGEAYCLDYAQKENDTVNTTRLMAILCVEYMENYEEPSDFVFTSTLLGISCVALLLTIVSLFNQRNTRSLRYVRKVRTLHGKIQLSYIISLLLAFLVIIINQQVPMEEGSDGCYAIAGFQLFFLLASFLWNTVICVEIFLFTNKIKASDSVRRYLGHSLYAWGLPAVITTVAVVLDKYRHDMPCLITPRIGDHRCSFSDDLAEMLYQYLPIFISTFSNLVLLAVANYRANHIISNKGKGRKEAKKQNSALRVHQSSNEVTTAITLSIWSGATWLLEVLIFASRFWVTPSGQWFEYLSYIPLTINCLRGVGICVIITLTTENRKQLRKQIGTHLPASMTMSSLVSPFTDHLNSHGSYFLSSNKSNSTDNAVCTGTIKILDK